MSDEVRRGISLNDPLASTAICIFASAVAGTGIGYFGCVLSYADKLASDPGGVHAKRARRLQRLGALGSTVFGISSLVGLFFGPVSLVVVVRAGSTLPANAFFSQASRASGASWRARARAERHVAGVASAVGRARVRARTGQVSPRARRGVHLASRVEASAL
jgi:hypothetical protein